MPSINVNQTTIYYRDQGQGTPIVLLHGVWMSSVFFQKQIEVLSQSHRVIAIDFRGHGQSDDPHTGHTVPQYADDVKQIIDALGLKDVVLVGWSMGAFVTWEYVTQFGTDNIKGTVIIDESASDFKWKDWSYGFADLDTLIHLMQSVQTDQDALLDGFLPLMFKAELKADDLAWMKAQMKQVNPATAGAILFDQTTRDFRQQLIYFTVPTLICFGRDEKIVPLRAADYFLQQMTQSELIIFEQSSHCPFLEEPEQFNQELLNFVNKI